MMPEELLNLSTILRSLQLFLAKEYHCHAKDIRIESCSEAGIVIKTQKANAEEEKLELDYEKTLSKLGIWLLENGGSDRVEGYYPIIAFHSDDIRAARGYWFTSKLTDAEIEHISTKIYTEGMGDSFEYSLAEVLEAEYYDLYNDERIEIESEIYEFFARHAIYNLDPIPETRLVELLDQEPALSSTEILAKLLDFLETEKYSPATLQQLRAELKLQVYIESISNLAEVQDILMLEVQAYDWLAGQYLEQELPADQATKAIIEQFHKEQGYKTELKLLHDLWARIGENTLILQNQNSHRQTEIVRRFISNNLPVEDCFQEIIVQASQASPSLSAIDPGQIRYLVLPTDSILQELKEGDKSLFSQKALGPDDSLPRGIDAVILNHNLEVQGILIHISQGFYFDTAKDAVQPKPLEKSWLSQFQDR